ncbi:tRNA-guanine transglycosylase [Halorutilales archaeon Cl-col2-1]
MTEFSIDEVSDDGYGRLGTLSVRNGEVNTPALFPVINLIGGTTLDSGSIWRHFRDNILDEDDLQGIMFQAMSFTEYGVSPKNLNEKWRKKTLREHLESRVDMNAPLFIDSGGFKLMNSKTFGLAPDEGGEENEWGIYTDPDSILKLQTDFGADIIATLDYPIPQNLKEGEKIDRMNQSIESAVRCLKLIEGPDKIEIRSEQDKESIRRLKKQKKVADPAVFVAIHGHDYETMNWYVMNFLERIEEENVQQPFHGFAIGSLVPLRSKTKTLVDIIQGAKDAIPEEKKDKIALHSFGVGGKQAGILSLLGVDSFDCSSHVQAAKFRKYIIPETWERVELSELAEEKDTFPCNIDGCPLCSEESEALDEEGNRLSLKKLNEYIEREPTYGTDGFTKSKYYGWLARHNFEVYNREVRRVQEAIKNGNLLDYVIEFAREDNGIQKGLKQAQVRDEKLRKDIEDRGDYDLLPGSKMTKHQSKLDRFDAGVKGGTTNRTISLEHGANSFNILQRNYSPPDKPILLILPCSKEKPYGSSRTQRAVLDEVSSMRNDIHKVTLSGMFGPVPEEYEEEQAVLEYEYVLTSEDEGQKDLITKRLTEYLEQYGDEYDEILGYVVSKNYREAVDEAFSRYGDGTVLPDDPNILKLREHFRKSNIEELVSHLRGISPSVE